MSRRFLCATFRPARTCQKSGLIVAIIWIQLLCSDYEPMNSAADYLTVQRVLNESGTKKEFQRALCVWLKIALSLNSQEIALAIGWEPASVRRIQSRFAKQGVQCFTSKAVGGRRRENLSRDREKSILEKFARQAKRGLALNVSQIKQAYELSAGKRVPKSTIYRLIHRYRLGRFLPRARYKNGFPK